MRACYVVTVESVESEGSRREEIYDPSYPFFFLAPVVGAGDEYTNDLILDENAYGDTPRIFFYFKRIIPREERELIKERLKPTIPAKYFDE